MSEHNHIKYVCEDCIRTFGNIASVPARFTIQRESILSPGTVLTRRVCIDHALERYAVGWEIVEDDDDQV